MPTPEAQENEVQATLSVFLGKQEIRTETQGLKAYEIYYQRTWKALRNGSPSEADTMGPVSGDHIQKVITSIQQTIADGSQCKRPQLKTALAKDTLFELHSPDSLDRCIDLALRLWLVLNIRDEDYCPGTHSIQWDDQKTLQQFVEEQFPAPRFFQELGEKMFDFALPDSFTTVKLKRYSGIKVEWTYDLSEHLYLDKDHRMLKIFPLKYYLNALRRCNNIEIIPHAVIDEYTKSMNLLFPSWDLKTQRFLRKRDQTFGMEAPVDYPGSLYLSDFHFWRDRLSILFTEFSSPPPSMTQLYHDRRNVLQWYTFWFAVLIVGLTVIFGLISSITACLSTLFTYEALLLAREAASSTASCVCSLPAPPNR